MTDAPRWRWPLATTPGPVPAGPTHPGAFGAVRRYDTHTGVDLYCDPGTAVVAVEPGVVVAVEDFTGPDAGSPWWNATRAVLVEGPSGVVLYGELDPAPDVAVGRALAAGDTVGHVVTVLRRDKALPTTMLHLELYARGTRASVWWRHGDRRPDALLDPTPHLAPEQ